MKNVCSTIALVAIAVLAIPRIATSQQLPTSTATARAASDAVQPAPALVEKWRNILLRIQSDPQSEGALPGCGPNTGDSLGASVPIPGDPQRRKGWLLHVQTDDRGNKYEIWCIEIAGGVGNSYGPRFIPVGGNPIWIGRCAFVGGQNVYDKQSTGDSNNNGNPDAWDTITWNSEDDSVDDDGQPGKKDYHWEFVPATKNLKRWETLDGRRIRPDRPDYNGPAPSDFTNVMTVNAVDTTRHDTTRHDTLLSDTSRHDRSRNDMNAAAAVGLRLDGEPMIHGEHMMWMYAIASGRIVEHTHTVIHPGDRLSMAASGIIFAQGPQGWETVTTPGYVTWTYNGTEPINLNRMSSLGGFMVMSSGVPGTSRWIAISPVIGGHFNMDGPVPGPAFVAAAHPAPRTLTGMLNAYPNPAREAFVAEFSVAHEAAVTVELYGVDGRLVRTLFKGSAEASRLHRLQVERDGLPSGTYLLKMQIGEEVHTQKVVME